MEITITADNFESEVERCDIPVLVDFWAQWCSPCRMLAPVIADIAKDYQGKVKVGKLDVDDEPGVALRFNVQSIPTIILFKGGHPVKTLVGLRSRAELEDMLG